MSRCCFSSFLALKLRGCHPEYNSFCSLLERDTRKYVFSFEIEKTSGNCRFSDLRVRDTRSDLTLKSKARRPVYSPGEFSGTACWALDTEWSSFSLFRLLFDEQGI